MYTISDFWVPMLGGLDTPVVMKRAPAGWATDITSFSSFIEAPLELANEYGNEVDCPILLVSAPGAVGKSTLASEIAAQSNAILIDLARAEAVGASTVTGGLAWAGLLDRFLQGDLALLIDGLDEARIRVTQESFVAFLEDIYRLASLNHKAITLFGRTSAIEDAWLTFAGMGIEPPVFEIQFHGPVEALEFVTCRVADARTERGEDANSTLHADRSAAELILENLGRQAQVDGERFVGYAPVLIAVSKRIAAERNPMKLVQDLEGGVEAISLHGIVDAIIERERLKLVSLDFSDSNLTGQLYQKKEQVERLISAVYGIDHVPYLPTMTQQDAAMYKTALDTWVPDHPFTDGTGILPSSEVFAGFIAAEALELEWSNGEVRNRELQGNKVNPFVWRFLLPEAWLEADELVSEEGLEYLPIADLGLAFWSLQSQLSRLESAHLFIDADIGADGPELGGAEVEITRFFEDHSRTLRLKSDVAGVLNFGNRISDVNISGNELGIVMSGSEIAFAAPVDLDVEQISVGQSGIVIEGLKRGMEGVDSVIRLRCANFVWSNNALSVRPGVSVAVDWPGSEQFPWHSYRRPEVPEGVDDEISERFRRLRKILVLFRARGKGQLAKYKGAIDHDRRARGSGAAVRDLLLAEGILFEQGRVYVLDTDRMRQVLDLSFLEIQSATVNEQTIEFLQRV